MRQQLLPAVFFAALAEANKMFMGSSEQGLYKERPIPEWMQEGYGDSDESEFNMCDIYNADLTYTPTGNKMSQQLLDNGCRNVNCQYKVEQIPAFKQHCESRGIKAPVLEEAPEHYSQFG